MFFEQVQMFAGKHLFDLLPTRGFLDHPEAEE